ncbi:Hypothetical predicted protein [Olea europaea subsp. europaea]|uniref:DUF1985 domain-containing protein n=1 Tax=Olea europaea subsp. europaea TaxID=158383 RepID=A0A8S0UYH4_OLEEU|nr:Hypothetical predicted protein [Olea europaea subsp. europaea]
MGLRYGLLPDDNVMERVLDKRRLKDKYFKHVDKISYAQLEQMFLRSSTPRVDRYKLGLALVIEGVFNALDNNVGIDMETLSIVDDLDLFFSYPWGRISYGRLIRGFGGRWVRKFLYATKKKENAVSYTVHDFPIAVQLHVYMTLHPTEVERGQPHITPLVPFDDCPVPALDDLARDNVAPQFHIESLGTPEEGTSEDETSDDAYEGCGTSGEEEESGADDSGETEDEDSEDHDSGDSDSDRAGRTRAADVDPDPRQSDYGGFVDSAGHHLLHDGPDKDMGIDRQEGDSMCITEEQMEPCSNEQDMPLPTGTESLQGT